MAIHSLLSKQIHEPTENQIDTVNIVDDAEVIEALASETARKILCVLAEQPATATELTEYTECTIQNITYHLEQLEDANLVENTGIAYSKKGRKMAVYQSTTDSITIEVERSADGGS